MAFAGSSNFTIHTLNAIDGRASGEDVFQRLVQKACLGAGHQSSERYYDAPKCHPETRKAVINDIMTWANYKVSKKRLMWMSGPAGAGKSSIAQTVCNRCHKEGKLLASFFFSRTASGTGRNDGHRLVPTVACQLATAIPESKSLIIKALEDPAVWSYSMEAQMEKLVLEPFSQVCTNMDSHSSDNVSFPYLVVIDGLDECNDSQMQSKIITMTADIFSNMNIPMLRFFIASRSELEIRNTFKSSSVSKICSRIVLNKQYKPDDDIRVYLQSELASLKREHTLSSTLLEDRDWPTSKDIDKLVLSSSGQFIYASTVIKYLKDPRRDPRDVLKSIIRDNDTTLDGVSPFTQINALYTQILNTAVSNLQGHKESMILVFQVLLFELYPKLPLSLTPKDKMAAFISMEQSELDLLLSDLHSIIFVPASRYPYIEGSLRFYHASFKDFLMDPARSGEFYIDKEQAHKALAHRCFKILSEYQRSDSRSLTHAEIYACRSYFSHIEESGFHRELLNELCYTGRLQKIVALVLNTYGQNENYDELYHFFVFRKYAYSSTLSLCPKNMDICDRMTDVIDNSLLSKYSSVESFLIEVIDVFTNPEWYSGKSFGFRKCWLARLIEHPTCGKHLFLDSAKCLSLYTRLCRTSEFRKLCRNPHFDELQHAKVLKYLLSRINPSAITDTDAFREISNQITSHERLMAERKDEVDSFLQSVDEFVVQASSSSCVVN